MALPPATTNMPQGSRQEHSRIANQDGSCLTGWLVGQMDMDGGPTHEKLFVLINQMKQLRRTLRRTPSLIQQLTQRTGSTAAVSG